MYYRQGCFQVYILLPNQGNVRFLIEKVNMPGKNINVDNG
jgi:hypothetical protein